MVRDPAGKHVRAPETIVSVPFVEVFHYNRWANRSLFDAVRGLTDEQLDFTGNGTSGTVRELLMHIAGGQQDLVVSTRGRSRADDLGRWSEWPGFDRLFDVVAETNDELIHIAETLDPDATVDMSYMGKTYRYPKRLFLINAIHHTIEHRTEVKVALNQLGVETPDLDGWPYAAFAGYGEEVE